MAEKEDIRLSKWLQGTITPEELASLKEEMDLDALKDVLDFQDQFEITTTDSQVMYQDFLERTKEVSYEGSKKRSEEKVTSQWQRATSTNASKTPWLWISLGLLGLAALLYFVLGSQKTTTVSKTGESYEFAMSDQSKIHLSPGSSISYDEENWVNDRSMELTGQAFFEVTKGSRFTVATSAGLVEVLGTSFDVWSQGRDHFKVVCLTGKVGVTPEGKETVVLLPGDEVQVNNGVVTRSDGHEQIDWMAGERRYTAHDARVMERDLERFFEIDLVVDDAIKDEKFTGILPTNDLNNALTYWCESMDWSFTRDQNKIYIKRN